MDRRSFWKALGMGICTFAGTRLMGAQSTEDVRARFKGARKRMVESQLRGRNITNEFVLKAMLDVPRHEFVPGDLRAFAYEDRPLSIGHGQTISQPYVVAFMTEQLDPKPRQRVLEVGTGSGYQAAILSRLVDQVYSIEIVEDLARSAATTLNRLGYTNVQVRAGDGYQGWPEAGPFDAILVACSPDRVPTPLTKQLKENGKMIIPVDAGPYQELILLTMKQGQLEQRAVLPVRFVPMTGEAQRHSGQP